VQICGVQVFQVSASSRTDGLGAQSSRSHVPSGMLRVRRVQATVVDWWRVRTSRRPTALSNALRRDSDRLLWERYINLLVVSHQMT